MTRKLGAHAGSAAAIEALLDELVARKQLCDERYAGERTHTLSRRYGAMRIRQDLRLRGVDDATAERAAAVAAQTDVERARTIYERRYRNPPANREERAKRTRFLQGRGFPHEIIRKLIERNEQE